MLFWNLSKKIYLRNEKENFYLIFTLLFFVNLMCNFDFKK